MRVSLQRLLHSSSSYSARTVLLSCLLALTACGFFDSGRQLRTFADMQIVAQEIQEYAEEHSLCPSETSANEIINRITDGLDAWDRPLFFEARQTADQCDWVLVSSGSDGVLEHPDLASYFDAAHEAIHNEPRRDIVFRNGEAVTEAGK